MFDPTSGIQNWIKVAEQTRTILEPHSTSEKIKFEKCVDLLPNTTLFIAIHSTEKNASMENPLVFSQI